MKSESDKEEPRDFVKVPMINAVLDLTIACAAAAALIAWNILGG
jgi:hypothetical protein